MSESKFNHWFADENLDKNVKNCMRKYYLIYINKTSDLIICVIKIKLMIFSSSGSVNQRIYRLAETAACLIRCRTRIVQSTAISVPLLIFTCNTDWMYIAAMKAACAQV